MIKKIKGYFDNNDYLDGFDWATEDDVEDVFEIDTDTFEELYTKCYFKQNNQLLFDNNKKQQIIDDWNSQFILPTWEETIEAQVVYTAMLTDTLLEE